MNKNIRLTGHVLLLLTILWTVLMFILSKQVSASWSAGNFIHWASRPDLVYLISYITVTLYTVMAIILFTVLFQFTRNKHPTAAFIGFLFVPIYGVLNLVCYSMQITFVPLFARKALSSGDFSLISQMIQMYGSSIMAYLNVFAYAILGIPSVIYGWLMVKEGKSFSGIFLALSGLLSVTGLVGMMMNHHLLSKGTIAGGIAFLATLICIVIEFNTDE